MSPINHTLYAHDIDALKALVDFCIKNNPYGQNFKAKCSLIFYVPDHDTYYISAFFDYIKPDTKTGAVEGATA